MATAITQEPLHLIDVDAIVVALGGGELTGPALELNTQTDGALQRMIDANETSLKVGVTTSWLAPSGIKAPVVMLVGLGCDSPENISYFKAAGAAAKALAAKQRDTVAYYFPECDAAALETAVSGSLVGCHGQDICRSKQDLYTPNNILWATNDELTVENGTIIAEGINLTRDLVNGPPNMVYPETFAEQIQSLEETTSLEIEVWDATKLAEEKCGSLLAVAQGSAREARLVIIRYRGSDIADPQLALVGKGVTYDSGGLSLKPSDGQKTMKCDMAGAATVVGTMQAISQLKLPCHVIGLVGLVENMVSSNAYRLGDVITARNGKTIEVLNTD
nr:peptidase M17 [Pirellulaceae bacterium]